jgi:hypothetical protein
MNEEHAIFVEFSKNETDFQEKIDEGIEKKAIVKDVAIQK